MALNSSDITIKVDAAVMQAKSSQVHQRATAIRREFDEIYSLLTQIKNYWKGDASDTFQANLTNIPRQANTMFDTLQSHSRNLNEIAAVFSGVESRITSEVATLPSSAID